MGSEGTLEKLKVVVEAETKDFRAQMKKIKDDMNASTKEIREYMNGINKSISDLKKEMSGYSGEAKKAQEQVRESMEKELEPVKKIREGIQEMNAEMRETAKIGQLYIVGSSYKKIEKDVEAAEIKVRKLESALRELESSGGDIQYTQEYKEIAKAIDQAEKKLRTLEGRQEKMEATGVSKNSRSWKSLQYDIDETGNSLRAMKIDMDNLSTSDRFTNTDKWIRLNRELDETRIKLAQASAAKQEFESTGAGNASASRSASGMSKGMQAVTASIKKTSGAFAALIQRFKNGIPLFNKGRSSSNNFAGSMKGLGGAMRTLGITARFMFASFVLMGTVNGAKEGLQNLAQYSDKTNQSISTLYSGMITLKNAFAVAFAPILNVIVPYLDTFISYIVGASNAVAQLLSALTGSSTWIKATKVQADYASSLDKTSGAAESAKKSILGFDEINALGSTSSSGGSGSGVNVGDMFSTEKVNSTFKSWADAIKESWKNADFTDLGNTVAQKIANALNGINWSSIQSTGVRFAKSLGTFINGVVGNSDLPVAVGSTIGNAINTGFLTVDTFLITTNWKQIGTFLATSLNKAIKTTDFSLVGKTLGDSIRSIAQTSLGFVTTFDFSGLGTKISSGINGFLASMGNVSKKTGLTGWQEMGKTFGAGLSGLSSAFVKALEKVNWSEFITGVKDALSIALDNLNVDVAKVTIGIGSFALLYAGVILTSSILKATIQNMFRSLVTAAFGGSALAAAGTSVAAGITIGAAIVVSFKLADDAKEWWKNIQELGWNAGRQKTAQDNKANPYNNGSAITQNDGSGVFDKWYDGLKTWQQKNREARDQEQVEWQNFVDKKIMPLFSTEYWKSKLGSIKDAIESKWTDFTNWWSNTAIVDFWNTNVVPLFSTDYWKGKLGSIRDAFADKWTEFTTWWNNTAVVVFWNTYVIPMFSKEYWKSKLGSIKDAFDDKWSDFTKWWQDTALVKFWKDVEDNISTKKWLSKIGSIKDAMETKWNEFKSWWGSLTIGFPKIKIPVFSWFGSNDSQSGSVGNIGISGYREYASGGFPSTGQMFLANENGPELVGKMGNKTTVANQDQIAAGFADAIYPAMYNAVLNAMNGNGGGTAPVIEFTFMVDSETFYQMSRKGEQSYNRRYKVVTSMT